MTQRTDRLNLRIDPELKARIQEYADRQHTTLSDLVTRHFVLLLQEEEKDDAEQI
jgi:uncharacterized protein (DUF1778 family)